MASVTRRIGLGALGLLAGLGAPRLAAQSWSVLASDPVGIARSGAGIAYGNSLEAASLNPALLGSLRDAASAFVAAGQELEITNVILQSNGITEQSIDRNRFLPSFGIGWRLEGPWALGLKLDQPFLRHLQMPLQMASRFEGQAFNLETHRLEAQASWSSSPNWSFGASVGATQIKYGFTNMVRVPLTATTSQPVSSTNNSLGLMELGVQEQGTITVPSYSLGFRWAPTSRWTVAGTFVGDLRGTLPLRAGQAAFLPNYSGMDGYGLPPVGASNYGPAIQALSMAAPGTDKLVLPGKVTLGVRQRVNALLTWEADLRYTFGSSTRLPSYPTLTGPNGTVSGAGLSTAFNNYFGASAMGELTLSKRWTLRLGLSEDAGLRTSSDVEPMAGGSMSFTASTGFGYKIAGGELSFGYQFRKSQTTQTTNLDTVWTAHGLTNLGDRTQVEGMGHLWSIGFKRAF